MNDIQLAWNTLNKQNLTLVIVKKGKILYRSTERGIKPLYLALQELDKDLIGASLADRVIGKAAALLSMHAGMRSIHT